MITLQLTLDQAQALHDLLSRVNIEPKDPLFTSFNQLSDHPLWPVLDALRQQLQIQRFKRRN